MNLLALVVEMYIALPIRFMLNPDLVPRIRIVDMWALGLVYAKIILRVQGMRPDAPLAAGITNVSGSSRARCCTLC